MALKSPAASDEANVQTAEVPEITVADRQAVDDFINGMMQLADQAATGGNFGFQDACLLLMEALSELPQNAAAETDLPALLEQWPALAAAYLQDPGAATAGLIEFLRQPLFNLALSDVEFSLLETQLAEGVCSEECAAVPEYSQGPDDFYAEYEGQDAGFQALTIDATETAFQALPRAAREIVELLLLEAASLDSCLLGVPLDDPVGAEDGLQQLAEKTDRFTRVAQTAGFEGLSRISEHVYGNIQQFHTEINPFSAEKLELLQAWVNRVKAYLPNFTASDPGQTLIAQLRDARWPLPLSIETGAAILAQLQAASLDLSFHEQPQRAHAASPADVSLALPEDVNQELLDLLLLDLPVYTLQFSEAMQRLQAGGSLQDLEVAQRIAHTLKGSANTVGIRGIAVLTHHLEDILLACANEEKLPRRALLETLLDAADCLESMSESIVESSAPPANAVTFLQQVLDWANRIDREGLQETDSGEIGSIKPSPEGQIRRERIWSPERPQGSGQDSPETLGWERGNLNKEKSLLISPHPNLLPEGEGAKSTASPPTPGPLTQAAMVRVPTGQIENLLRISGESIILNGQASERQRRIKSQLLTMEIQFAQLQQLGAELERLIDVKDLSDRYLGSAGKEFDTLEMDQYNELHTAGRRMVEAAVDAREMAQDIKKELAQMEEVLEYQQRLVIDTQEAVMQTRLVPVASIAPRLQRALRQTCRLTGKQAELTLSGGELLIDGDTLNALVDPLMHILRNAVDHGIESENERLALGKMPGGRITVAFDREGNNILVRCRDDGRGLDFPAIRAAAEKRGVLKPGQEAAEEELQRFILRPNFSTRTYSTQTSGRGVGMDAVHAQVVTMGGTLLLHSSAGRGLSVDLRLPLPLSRSHALLATVGRFRVAISSKGVQQILFGGEGETKTVGQERMLLLGDEIYPLVKLETLLQVSEPRKQPRLYGAVLLVKNADRIWAVLVDSVTDSREVVIKNLGYYIAKIPGIIGATILGDGTVTPVLDLPELLRTPADVTVNERVAQPQKDDTVAHLPAVLLVDDSLSQRRALEQLLADAGFQVRTARDGIEAAELLAQFKPAMVLTDLEMPRMNGIELTAHIRAQTYGKTLPVIMITSRTTAKHRKMAEDAGIDCYLAKPVRDDELLSKMQSLLQANKIEEYV